MNKIPTIDINKGCPLLDYQISVDTDGMLYPCCNTINYKFDNLADLRNWQQTQKQQFSKNQWPDACSICNHRERNAGFSQRVDSHAMYKYDSNTATPTIKDLQVSYKNLCNLSCIMCDVNGSSSVYEYAIANETVPINWNQDGTKHMKVNKKNLELILDAAPTLQNITLLGGEPFLIKEYIPILDKLSDSCVVLVVTNGTVYNHEFIKHLIKFKSLTIMFSVDGYEIVNEALRLNSKWSAVEKNVLRIKKEFPNATVGLCPTWTNFNIFHWEKFYNWSHDAGIYYPKGFWQNVVEYPEHLKLCYISDNWKEHILNNCANKDVLMMLTSWFNEPQIENIMSIKEQWRILKDVGATNGFDYETLFPHIYKDFNTFQQN